jgi:putative endonuclease
MSFATVTLALERRVYTAVRAMADRTQARRAVRLGVKAKPPHLLTGEVGEDAAFFYLRELGYTIVARRWRTERSPGDLDLVGWDGDTLIVFEVKTRSARGFLPAEIAVDVAKQKVLRRIAQSYLQQIPESHRGGVRLRFDVLAVYLLPAGNEFRHLPNAFPRTAPTGWARR